MATLNGEQITADDALTLGLTGYGHFTSMRVELGAVRGLRLHLDRLRTYYCFDMCGNVWEWTATEGTAPGRYRLKGGSWASPMFAAEPSVYNDAAAEMIDNDTGFRCVSTTEP